METNIDELLDTKGVTVAYGYPTPPKPRADLELRRVCQPRGLRPHQ
jgi:hypothetical protein